MICRSTDVRSALRSRQRGFLLNPYRFGVGPTDPDYASVVSLLHFNGANGSTTLVDQKGNTAVVRGDSTIDTSQSVYGGSSVTMDGTGSGATITHSAAFNAAGDYAIELWVRFDNFSGNSHVFGKYVGASTAPYAIYRSGSQVGFYSSSNGSAWDIVSNLSFGSGLSTGVWYFFQIIRSGNDYTAARNGSVISTITASGTPLTNAGDLTLGWAPSTAEDTSGWIDDFRFTVGVPRAVGLPGAQFPDA